MFAYPDVAARPDTRMFEKPGGDRRRQGDGSVSPFPRETGDTEPSPVSSSPRYNRKEVRKKK